MISESGVGGATGDRKGRAGGYNFFGFHDDWLCVCVRGVPEEVVEEIGEREKGG